MSSVTVAFYVTGHGLGHGTRVAEICKHLLAAGHVVHVVTAVPEWVFVLDLELEERALFHHRKVMLDCGATQQDALSVDRVGSLQNYFHTAVKPRESLLAIEEEWLRATEVQVVVSDIVPLACAAAAKAGIPSVCVTNFSWDFVYADYLTAAGTHHQHLQQICWQIAEDYSTARLLLRLPGYSPMPAFGNVVDVPLVTRKARRSRAEVRATLGVAADTKLVLYQFGGQDVNWTLRSDSLPEGWTCVLASHTLDPTATLPARFIRAPVDAYIPDLVGAVDCVLGKIGYGTTSESLAHNVPLVFVRRSYFNEEPFLRKLLELNDCMVEMSRRDFFAGRWQSYLEHALTLKPSYSGATNGGSVVTDIVAEVALGRYSGSGEASGKTRLRDAIVFGYNLARAPHKVSDPLEVPSWYTQGLTPACVGASAESAAARAARAEGSGGLSSAVRILHGTTHKLPDTEAFVNTLVLLRDGGKSHTLPERRAAAGLFDWTRQVVVTRAPGRLDVMGGIADYSGSLVLEMPIREACHVALQRQPEGAPPAWRHTRERHQKDGGGGGATLQVVSFGADLTDRAPTFDMDLKDLFHPSTQKPISFKAANAFFQQDPARSWAAYVVGALLVLLHEKPELVVTDSISILVESAVPEGKGVSSSAAIEVATMAALAAAYDVMLEPTELAILCQKVENLVVGAPCGVMDQMTSVCGEEGKLLALLCQPAVITGHVAIPPHLQFWGIDSGIRHSVGGSDYGSVRVGAFMGKRLVGHLAVQGRQGDIPTVSPHSPACTSAAAAAAATAGPKRQKVQQEDFYLAAIPPHEFERAFAAKLPDSLVGDRFLAEVGDHRDKVTTVMPHVTYDVRTPTAHPVYENFRTQMFHELMRGPASTHQLQLLGQLMFQSHVSYSQCGLGSSGTDRLVALVEQAGSASELYGAKITGGGSGGTVCVVGKRGAQADAGIEHVLREYSAATAHKPHVFHGSSPGAAQFGHLKLSFV